MNLKLLLLLFAVGFGAAGCTLIKIVPMIPEMADGMARTKSIELDQAYNEINEGKFDRAEKVLKDLERDHPSPLLISEIAYIRALIAERVGALDDALTRYRAVIADFPHTPDAYFAAKKVRRLEAARKTASPTPFPP